MKTVLILNPYESQSNSYHLSPIYLQLKSHFIAYGAHATDWEWLDPITYTDGYTFGGLAADIVSKQPTVLAISLQMWNATLAMALGRAVKQLSPTTRIVVGGPHTDHKYHMDWFKHYDFVDVLCSPDGYGEDFMTALLDAISSGNVDYSIIPNAVYPSPGRSFWKKSTVSTDKREFKYPPSIFLGSDEYVSTVAVLAKHQKRVLVLNYETSRGCPYACSFCDWPGGLRSRIVRKPDDVMDQELIDIERYQLNEISLTDANFGALGKRDHGILQSLVDISKRGALTAVTNHGRAKHSIEVVERLDTMLLDAGLYSSDEYTISINAADDEVLKAIDRINPNMEKVIEVATRIRTKYNKFIVFEMIMGLPLYNLDKFYTEFDLFDAVEGWLTERNPWALLTESAGATPEYRARYNVKTARVGSFLGNNFGKQLNAHRYEETTDLKDAIHQSTYEIVVSTNTYTSRDWCEMFIVDHFARALELSHYVDRIRKDLKALGMPASTFYRRLWSAFSAQPELQRALDDIQYQTNNIVEGNRLQYKWFDNIVFPTVQIKLEAYFNLLVLRHPDVLEAAVKSVGMDLLGPQYDYSIGVIKCANDRDLLELATNILAPKVH